MQQFVYSIENDFPNSKVNPVLLEKEIYESTITIALNSIDIDTNSDKCVVSFKADLSSAEETTLSGIVSGHTGEAIYEVPTPHTPDGRAIVRADSRPVGWSTMFTMAGDTASGVGDGKALFWDFSNDDDIVTTSGVVPDGYKLKRINISFADPVYIKEGCNYFTGALKGSYLSFCIVCPSGQYYLSRTGAPQLASDDVCIVKYVNRHFFSGDCPMGDELNTEGCAESALPPNYEMQVEVYVPDSDNSSYGWAELELYRERTILLPGETI